VYCDAGPANVWHPSGHQVFPLCGLVGKSNGRFGKAVPELARKGSLRTSAGNAHVRCDPAKVGRRDKIVSVTARNRNRSRWSRQARGVAGRDRRSDVASSGSVWIEQVVEGSDALHRRSCSRRAWPGRSRCNRARARGALKILQMANTKTIEGFKAEFARPCRYRVSAARFSGPCNRIAAMPCRFKTQALGTRVNLCTSDASKKTAARFFAEDRPVL